MKPGPVDVHPVCRLRSGLLCCGLLFGFLLVFCRLFFLQVLQAEQGALQAERQHQRTILVQPDRGTIFDQQGHPLAMNIEVASLVARPGLITDARQTARALAPLLKEEQGDLRKLLTRKDPFVWVQRHIQDGVAQRIEELNLPGLELVKEPHRFYPKETLVSHLVGFAGIDNQGLEGIERQYETFLRGKENLMHYQRDALGRRIAPPLEIGTEALPTGYHLMLTLDEVVQFIAEEE